MTHGTSMEYAVVAFMDVLGFAEMVQADSRAPAATRLMTFLQIFQDIRETYGGAVRMFSDSIVIEASLDLEGVKSVISIAGKLQREFLRGGILVRGGVAFGKHFSDANTIYSEALVNAYYIESKKARNPRIVVDPNLIDFFSNHPTATDADRMWLSDNLCRDRDGFLFIEYIGVQNIEELTPNVAQVIADSAKGNDSIVDKVCWMLDYHSFSCERSGRHDLRIEGNGLKFSAY